MLENRYWQQADAYYRALAPREQLALKALAIFLAALLFYFLLWAPSAAFKDRAERQFTEARNDLAWMEANRHRVSPVDNRGGSLLSRISNAAKNAGLEFKRYDNLDQNQIRVVLEKQSFSALVNWLAALENAGAEALEIAVERDGESGRVNARVLIAG